MKKLAILIGICTVAIIGLLIAGSMQPTHFHFERSTTVAAPPAVLYGILSDFHRFGEWSPWEHLDPAMTKTFEGPPSGVGSIYRWKGNDEVGEGAMTITESVPNQKVAATLEFIKPWQATNQSSWVLTPEGPQTKVTWSMDGTHDSVIHKTFSLLMMDTMLGRDFESGLAGLKRLAEGGSQPH